MHILALNAYHGGSHQAFLDSWMKQSRHTFDVLTLPAYKWKWRMRHAAVTFADEVTAAMSSNTKWDALFCTDMLNLAEFLGLCPPTVRSLPAILYFHENQLTYPNRQADERDLHFGFTNLTSALAATSVWFNSEFHREEFLAAVTKTAGRMPDYRPLEAADRIRIKSKVLYPGVAESPTSPARTEGPLQIVWVSRWEHDKDPETFFHALSQLQAANVEFRLHVLGESFADSPACFEEAKTQFASQIDHWGFLESRETYHAVLASADVVVSTARHEFFGIGVLEAALAGCFPLVPQRLAYPEVYCQNPECFYDGTVDDLTRRLAQLSAEKSAGTLHAGTEERIRLFSGRFGITTAVSALDRAVELTGFGAGSDANGHSTDSGNDHNFRCEL